MARLEGVWSASITPLQSDMSPDPAETARHIDWMLERGCHGVVFMGSTGEANSFSVRERRAFLDGVLERGVDPSKLIVGTGCCAIPDSIELSQHATDVGCAGVLLLPPFYYKTVSEDGLFASIAGVIEGSASKKPLNVILYHFPRMSGVGYSIGVTQRLKKAFPAEIGGVKDSSGDTDNLTRFCREVEGIDVFAGSEALLPYVLNEGGVGCISATANVTSRLARAFYDGENGLADRMIRTRKAFEGMHFVPVMKHLLADYHKNDDWRRVRAPLTMLNQHQRQQLDQILASLGAIPNFQEKEAA